jgi:hypothetical protein
VSGEALREKDKLRKFSEESANLKRQRTEAIRRLKAAGHKEVVPCEMSRGGIWVGRKFYLNPERALSSLGVA